MSMPTTPLPLRHGTRAHDGAEPSAGPRHAEPGAPGAGGRHAEPAPEPVADVDAPRSTPRRPERTDDPSIGAHRSAARRAAREPDEGEAPSAGPDETGELEVPPRLLREAGWVLLVGGVVGAVVALVLLVEKLSSLQNPNYVPSCSIDPVLSCGTIMKTAQASVLGFPNPVIGLLTFPLVAMSGALVLARVELPRWTWLALQFGSAAGLAFIAWLIIQSLAVIHALCPYCMVAWTAVVAIFWMVTAHNLAAGHLELGSVGDAVARRRWWVVAASYLVVVACVLSTFPAYFGAMVGLG